MGDSLPSCTTLQFWSDDLPCGPATVSNSPGQEIFPSFKNFFLLKYSCWLHIWRLSSAGDSRKARITQQLFRSQGACTTQPWEATLCATLTFYCVLRAS